MLQKEVENEDRSHRSRWVRPRVYHIPAVAATFFQTRVLNAAREDFIQRLTREAQRISEGDSMTEELIVTYGRATVDAILIASDPRTFIPQIVALAPPPWRRLRCVSLRFDDDTSG